MNLQNQNQNQSHAAIDSFGRAVAARLAGAEQDLSHDISERLRAARVRAVAKRRLANSPAAAGVLVSGGELALPFNSHHGHWKTRLMALLPLLLLVVGLMFIGFMQDQFFTDELAEVDSEILTDALPPAAYTDPGFLQYLRSRQAN